MKFLLKRFFISDFSARFYNTKNVKRLVARLKHLQGDPHRIALGMAVGVFIGVTPTFPFHTMLALAIATLMRGSPAAAAIGVWFGNPLTMPFFLCRQLQDRLADARQGAPAH